MDKKSAVSARFANTKQIFPPDSLYISRLLVCYYFLGEIVLFIIHGDDYAIQMNGYCTACSMALKCKVTIFLAMYIDKTSN